MYMDGQNVEIGKLVLHVLFSIFLEGHGGCLGRRAHERQFEFVPERVASLYDEDLEAMLGDKCLIRHMGKLQATRHNAQAMRDIASDHGSFAAYVADWSLSQITGLWADLARRMKHLGGNSAPVFLRMMGKDTFILTDFVVRGLNHWEAFDGTPKTKAAQAQLQDVFNAWHVEMGKPFSHLSMILAMSVD